MSVVIESTIWSTLQPIRIKGEMLGMRFLAADDAACEAAIIQAQAVSATSHRGNHLVSTSSRPSRRAKSAEWTESVRFDATSRREVKG